MAFTTAEEIEAFGNKITVEHWFKFNVPGTQAKWTGWKYGGWNMGAGDLVRDFNEGFCAQLVWYRLDGNRALYGYYVNLPGMQSGKFMPGARFDIGDKRVRKNTPLEDLDPMIEAGWKQLVELVQKEEGVDISNLRKGTKNGKPFEVSQVSHRPE